MRLNLVNLYIYYIDLDLEDIRNFETSEEKIIGYLALESERSDLELFRYFKEDTFDHICCVLPNEKLLLNRNYRKELDKGFDGTYLLREAGENLIPIYVYSTNPGTFLFTPPSIEPVISKSDVFDESSTLGKPALINEQEIIDGIKKNIDSGKKFWWLNTKIYFWQQNDPKGKSNYYVEHFDDEQDPYELSIEKGDIVISSNPKTNQITGLFEFSDYDPNNEYRRYKGLYAFKEKTPYNDLIELLHFGAFLNEYTTGRLHELGKSYFKEIIDTTELGPLALKDPSQSTDLPDSSDPDTYHSEQKNAAIDNDGAFSTEDLLDIENDVRSFALLLASKSVKPPLAIALFGKWGLGKSFFMKHLQKRIDELSKNQRFLLESEEDASTRKNENDNEQFCEGIAQIEFNAWSYLDANLWAGLVASIFEKLNEYLTNSTKSGIAKMKVIEKLKKRLKTFQTQQLSEQDRKEELIKLKKGYKIESENLKKSIESNFRDKILGFVNADEKLSGISADISEDNYLSILQEELKLNELQNEAKIFKSFWRNLKKSKSLIKYFIFAFVGVALGVLVWQTSNQLQLIWGGLLPIIASFGIDIGVIKKRYNSVKKFVVSFNQIVEENDQLAENVKEHRRLVQNVDQQIIEADEQIKELDQKIDEFQQYMEREIHQETIRDFIQTRADHSDYKDKLGIVSIIRRDFETLSELFYESESKEDETNSNDSEISKDKEIIRAQFREGKKLERIILYIDDLDRCDDEKVLEVIQAVHLLMAFPLFNVVVGVDKRCVRNALLLKTKLEYLKIAPLEEIEDLGIHMISPGEYLEKIFQIPFELKEPKPKDFEALADYLLENQIEEEIIDVVQKEEIPGFKTKEEPEEKSEEQVTTADDKERETKLEPAESESEPKAEKEPAPAEEEKNVPVLVSSVPDNLRLSQLEVDQIKEILFLVGSTPRTIKRFINIYRIIRAHKRPEMDKELKSEDHLVIMFLLAIGIGEYKLWRDEIYHLLAKHPNYLLSTVLNRIKGDEEFEDETKNLKMKFKEIDEHPKIKEVLTLKGKLFINHIPFLTRFSFGKEITTPDLETQSA